MSDLWDEVGKGTRVEFPDDADIPGEWLVTEIEDVPNGKRVTFMRFDPE